MNSFEYIPSHGISGSYSNFIFNSLRNLHPVHHNNCTILHPSNSHKSSSFSVSLSTFTFVILCAFDSDHANGCVVIRYLIVLLIYISIIISDIEYLLCWLAICVSSLKTGSSRPLPIFKIRFFVFCCWVVKVPYIFWV